MIDSFKRYIKNQCTDEDFDSAMNLLLSKDKEVVRDSFMNKLWDETSSEGTQPDLTKTLYGIHYHINKKEEGKKISLMTYFSRIAAILILPLSIALLYFASNNFSSEVITQTISTPLAAFTSFDLPDGSTVWLNSGSTLTYPSEFDKNRPVTLNGEAFFEVKKNGKPFIVSTLYGEVEVKGTSFNVKAFENENLETTLITGSVLVKQKDSHREVTLKPGQHAVLANGQINVSKVETDIFTSWKEGKLIFRKEYLRNAIKRLERWYNVKIELDDDERLNDIWFNGTLEMESFSEVLELLKVTSPIDYKYDEKTRTIRINYKQK